MDTKVDNRTIFHPIDTIDAALTLEPARARAADASDARPHIVGRHQVLLLVLAVGVVGLVIAALPAGDDVRSRLASVDGGWAAAALALEIGSCLAFVPAFHGVLGMRLPRRFTARLAFGVQGANVALPTGGAGGFALAAWGLRRAGVPGERIARRSVALFLLTSAVNFATLAIGGLAVAAGIAGADVPVAYVLVPALGAVATIAFVASLPRLDRRLRARQAAETEGRMRFVREGLVDGVRDTGRLLRSGGVPVVGGAIGYMVLDLAALAAAFAAIGGGPAAGALAVGYVMGQLGGLVPTPGGVGGTDGGLVAALVLYGSPLGAALAAVVLYRIFQLGVPALLGAASLATLGEPPRVTPARKPAAARRRTPCTAAG
jgi:uncharacterized membrane protein YbhN (UPF0104 family)